MSCVLLLPETKTFTWRICFPTAEDITSYFIIERPSRDSPVISALLSSICRQHSFDYLVSCSTENIPANVTLLCSDGGLFFTLQCHCFPKPTVCPRLARYSEKFVWFDSHSPAGAQPASSCQLNWTHPFGGLDFVLLLFNEKTVKNVDSIKVWLHVISVGSGACLLLQYFWAKDATCRWSIVVSAKQVLPVHWNNNYVQMEDQITYLVQTSHQLRQIGWKADLFQLLNHCYFSGLLQYDTVSGLPGRKKLQAAVWVLLECILTWHPFEENSLSGVFHE